MLAGIRDETPHRTDPLVAPAAAVAPTTGRRRAVTARLSALLLFVGAVAWFGWGVGTPEAWSDEAVTVLTIERPWSAVWSLWNSGDATLTPYYLALKAWSEAAHWLGFAPGVTVARSFSVAAAAAATACLYLLVRRSAGELTALLAGVVFMALPGVSRYAQEARPYALLMAAAAFSWLLADSLWRAADAAPGQVRPRTRLTYTLSLVVLALTNLFGLLQWVAQACAALIGRPRWPRLRVPLPQAIAATGLVAVPVAIMATRGSGARVPSEVNAFTVTDMLQVVALHVGAPPLLGLFLLLLTCCGLLGLRTQRLRGFVVRVLIWLVVPALLATVFALVRSQLFRVRYWMPAALPIAVLAAIGIAEVAGAVAGVWQRQADRSWAARATRVTVAAALLVALWVAMLPLNQRFRAPDGHDATLGPVIARILELRAEQPGMAVLVASPGQSVVFATSPAPGVYRQNVYLNTELRPESVYPAVESFARLSERLTDRDRVLVIRMVPTAASATSDETAAQRLAKLGFRATSDWTELSGWQLREYRR